MLHPQRILYVINALAAGGTERQLLYLIGNLDPGRFEPHVLTLFDESKLPYFYKAELQALGVPIHTLAHKAGWLGRIRALLRYIRLMWRLRPRLVQGCLHHANLITRVCRPFCPPHALLTSARATYQPGELRSEARTHWLDDGLIVNGPQIQEQVSRKTRRDGNRVFYIPNGIPVEHFLENTNPELRRQLFPNAEFVIGMIGRIARQKDHKTLIEALHLVSPTLEQDGAAFLLGDVGESDVEAEIEAMLKDFQRGVPVRRISAAKEVASYYYAADVIVLPSLYEGFPNVILEAFATARPVIASENADELHLVIPGQTGWRFPTGDAQALAACLKAACRTTPAERARMGQNARSVAAQYSVPTMVSQYTALYTKMLI